MPSATAREFQRVASQPGFVRRRQTGSQVRWNHPESRAVTISIHGGRETDRPSSTRSLANSVSRSKASNSSDNLDSTPGEHAPWFWLTEHTPPLWWRRTTIRQGQRLNGLPAVGGYRARPVEGLRRQDASRKRWTPSVTRLPPRTHEDPGSGSLSGASYVLAGPEQNVPQRPAIEFRFEVRL